jgi:hypothetical protein
MLPSQYQPWPQPDLGGNQYALREVAELKVTVGPINEPSQKLAIIDPITKATSDVNVEGTLTLFDDGTLTSESVVTTSQPVGSPVQFGRAVILLDKHGKCLYLARARAPLQLGEGSDKVSDQSSAVIPAAIRNDINDGFLLHWTIPPTIDQKFAQATKEYRYRTDLEGGVPAKRKIDPVILRSSDIVFSNNERLSEFLRGVAEPISPMDASAQTQPSASALPDPEGVEQARENAAQLGSEFDPTSVVETLLRATQACLANQYPQAIKLAKSLQEYLEAGAEQHRERLTAEELERVNGVIDWCYAIRYTSLLGLSGNVMTDFQTIAATPRSLVTELQIQQCREEISLLFSETKAAMASKGANDKYPRLGIADCLAEVAAIMLLTHGKHPVTGDKQFVDDCVAAAVSAVEAALAVANFGSPKELQDAKELVQVTSEATGMGRIGPIAILSERVGDAALVQLPEDGKFLTNLGRIKAELGEFGKPGKDSNSKLYEAIKMLAKARDLGERVEEELKKHGESLAMRLEKEGDQQGAASVRKLIQPPPAEAQK